MDSLSKEEKEAIEILKGLCSDDCVSKDIINTITKLIDKLQKENEELKAINSMQKYRIEVIDERELISKDEIRNKIKKLKEEYQMYVGREYSKMNDLIIEIKVLEELLGDKNE